MATLDPDTETGVRVLEEESNTVSSWGGSPPKQEFLERVQNGSPTTGSDGDR